MSENGNKKHDRKKLFLFFTYILGYNTKQWSDFKSACPKMAIKNTSIFFFCLMFNPVHCSMGVKNENDMHYQWNVFKYNGENTSLFEKWIQNLRTFTKSHQIKCHLI